MKEYISKKTLEYYISIYNKGLISYKTFIDIIVDRQKREQIVSLLVESGYDKQGKMAIENFLIRMRNKEVEISI